MIAAIREVRDAKLVDKLADGSDQAGGDLEGGSQITDCSEASTETPRVSGSSR